MIEVEAQWTKLSNGRKFMLCLHRNEIGFVIGINMFDNTGVTKIKTPLTTIPHVYHAMLPAFSLAGVGVVDTVVYPSKPRKFPVTNSSNVAELVMTGVKRYENHIVYRNFLKLELDPSDAVLEFNYLFDMVHEYGIFVHGPRIDIKVSGRRVMIKQVAWRDDCGN